jgi:hypothetical protein
VIRDVEAGNPPEARVVLVNEAAERVFITVAKCLDQADLGVRAAWPSRGV